ncbi:MAG: hypothetical protein K8T90_22535 [Planctomycetes bacterium]|nr:hypothetical protein [Planctomycetota bacterium]
MKPAIRAARLLPLALLAASCGVGGMLAASGGGGGGGGGSSNPLPPPQVIVASPTDPAVSNLVTFSYVLRDDQVKRESKDGPAGGADDPRVRIHAQWQSAPPPVGAEDTWFEMSRAEETQGDGVRALSLGQHTFVWNTLPDLGGAQARFKVHVRVLAEYEETAGLKRRFRSRVEEFTIDNRYAGTILGADVQPPTDVDTFPVDLRPDGDGFLVADFGANVVERVDSAGLIRRYLGFGVPGDTVGTGKSPGVARLQTLIGLETDPFGNLYTNHSNSILVTNRNGAPIHFGGLLVPAFTVVRAAASLQDARDVRFHPSGALLFLDQGTQLVAFNPREPGAPGSLPIVLAGVSIAPGASATIAGGGATTADEVASTAAELTDAVGVGIGPDGEIYVVERGPSRVRVVNPGTTNVVIAGVPLAPGAIRTVAGDGTPGFSGDDGAAASAQLRSPGAIDVTPARGLFIADTLNVRVRLVNLGASAMTFAEATVLPGNIGTVAGGGTGGVGSKAREIQLAIPNALALDANSNLLVADERTVILVNGGTAAVTSYGKTAGAARTARVYDASRRGGVPLTEPRALHSSSPTELFFTDRATIRVMNLGRDERTFGGEAAAPGASSIIGGGSVPGFGGDGGSARGAAFANPSGLATQGSRRLFVADTGNQRIRLLNLGDPRLPTSETETYLGKTIAPGNVDTIVGGGPSGQLADGDGGPAASASLLGPEGVAIGPDGLVWICDTGHHRIRVANPGLDAVTVNGITVGAGSVQTIVGNGTSGFTADGAGPWRTSEPSCVVLDNQGVVYFGERGNARIRALNVTGATVTRAGLTIASGAIRTLVGTGVPGNGGDGGDGPSAQIRSPRALFVQSRLDATAVALYFSDEDSHVVRMLNLTTADDLALAIDFDGRVTTTIPAASIYTVAGGPNTPGFNNPGAFSGDGEIAERVRFNAPFGIAVTTADGQPAHFFVGDRRNDRVRRFGAPPLVKTN